MDAEHRTDRLLLSVPDESHLDAVHAIYADERVWTHFPSLRHTDRAQTARLLESWRRSWRDAGLGSWVVRLPESGAVIGNGGCTIRPGEGAAAAVWNLGYRLSADHHGRGYATELSRAALARAAEIAPERPVIAFLVEHNRASAAVAEKVGLTLVHRAPDVGNPDPFVQRLVYADRPLTPAQLATALS
ncbi:GNAT family N-acetyltransferase [Microbacterium resistens]|uniref:GNAT family N-acetyltransferase n=1 Tax=Microbacterium resistens TaxID=156977 RepID=UPI001C599C4D|nr:GNAT family N-acetyltransferase [Microbacterium resistens]MBW1640837.1 GNAT family N-acetyltransferase [Microbacterium resistens]